MNKSEAAELLGYCAAFDNRTVGIVDATGWAAALHDVPLDDDARAAVARYYGTPPERPGERLWIQPHHVRSGRLAIRQERLGTTLPAYIAPPGLETGAEFVARRQQQIDDVAAGLAPARPIGALTGGPARSVVKGLAARGFAGVDRPRGLAPVGEQVTDDQDDERQALIEQVRRPGPLGVECPKCRAPIGRPCRVVVGGKRRELRQPHSSRSQTAAGQPVTVESAEVIERRREVFARLQQMAADDGQVTS